MDNQTKIRRYDLDWLRVILFGILVPYHALIGFVSYGHEIYGYRNQDVGGDLAEFTVFAFHAWRLPALFVISGVGTYFLFRNKGVWRFVKNRTIRLILPLLVGAFLWNGITSFYQVTAYGEDWNFFAYQWHRWQNLTPRAMGHLWFLANLFVYSIIAIPMFVWMLKDTRTARRWVAVGALLVLIAMPLVVKPYVSVREDIGWKEINYFVYYVLGFWIMILPQAFWETLSKLRFLWVGTAIVTLASLGLYLDGYSSNVEAYTLLLSGGWVHQGWPIFDLGTSSFSALYAVNTALWCCAIFAFGFRYLNRPAHVLPMLNRSVFPFYVFHFPILMVGLFYLTKVSWPWFWEFLILTTFTYFGTGLIVYGFSKVPAFFVFVGFPMQKR